jgi:membrane protein required for colicin V production
MTVIDVVFASLLGLSVLWGVWRGLTRELVSTIAWVLIAVLAYRYGASIGHLIPFTGPPILYAVVGAGIIAVAGIVAAAIIGRLLRATVKASQLAGADRVLGGMFGAVRGALVLLLVSALVVEFGFSDTRVWRQSASGPYLEHVWHWMAGSMPERHLPLVLNLGG